MQRCVCVWLGGLALTAGTANGQPGIVAGQTAGLRHVLLSPALFLASRLTYVGPNTAQNTLQKDSLDVDQDGKFDVVVVTDAFLQAGKYPLAEASILIRDGEILKTQTTSRPTAVALSHNARIEDSTQPFILGSSTPTWAAVISGQPTGSLTLALQASNPGGLQQIGEWYDGTPHYVGFRLGNASTGYRYGWLTVQAGVQTDRSALIITEYAIQPQTALPTRTAVSTFTLDMLGPNPTYTTQHLRLPSSGELRVYDALGRLMTTKLVASGVYTLDMAGWPPGQYVVSLFSTQGRYSRRLQKQ